MALEGRLVNVVVRDGDLSDERRRVLGCLWKENASMK